MNKKCRLAACLFAVSNFLFAQSEQPFTGCGHDLFHQNLFEKKPDLIQKWAAMDEKARTEPNRFARSQGPISLPVVFHIVHENGAENLAQSRLEKAVEWLNQSFEHAGQYAQNSAGVDAGFRFCLARRTPQNQPSDGSTRTVSPLTTLEVFEDDTLKRLVRWPNCINIWVVREIVGDLAGYSSFPFSSGDASDGIVVEARWLGDGLYQNGVLTHEMGHFLGLYHTWQGGCQNQNCETDGDRVCDTPPDQATFSACPFNSCASDEAAPAPNPFLTDVPDATDNFMDYTACWNRFTEGQAERMRVLTEQFRSDLIASAACLEPCPTAISAAIKLLGSGPFFVGDTVFFQNQSLGATVFEWQIDGVAAGFEKDFSTVFDSVGLHRIRLKASGDGPNCVEFADFLIKIECNLTGAGIVAPVLEAPLGQPISLAASVSNAQKWAWAANGLPFSSDSAATFLAATAGGKSIVLTVENGVCLAKFSVDVRVIALCEEAQANWRYENISNPTMLDFGPKGQLFASSRNTISCFEKNGDARWSRDMSSSAFSFAEILGTKTLDDGGVLVHFINGEYPLKSLFFRLDSLGKQAWTTSQDSFIYTAANSMAAHSDGRFLNIFGWGGREYVAAFDEKGENLWSRFQNDPKLEQFGATAGPSGGYFWALVNIGDSLNNADGGKFAHVKRLSASGEMVWEKRYDLGENCRLRKILPEANGGFSLLFQIFLSYETAIIRCDSTGAVLWAKKYPLNYSAFLGKDQYGKASDGGFFMRDFEALDVADYFRTKNRLIRLNPDGSIKWAKAFHFASNSDYYSLFSCAGATDGRTVLGLYHEPLGLHWLDSTGSVLGCLNDATIPFSSAPLIPKVSDLGFSMSIGPAHFGKKDAFLLSNSFPKKKLVCLAPSFCDEKCSNGGIDDDRDGFTDGLDPDCLPQKNECSLDSVRAISMEIEWKSSLTSAVHRAATPIVADFFPQLEGGPEVLIAKSSQTSTIDQHFIFTGEGNVTFSYANFGTKAVALNPAANPLVADLLPQSQGLETFITSNDTRGSLLLSSFNSPNPSANQNNTPPFYGWKPQTADFDADGQPEIYFGSSVLKYSVQNFLLLVHPTDTLRPSGQLAYQNLKYRAANSVAAELGCNDQVDCDGLELAAGPAMYSFDGTGWDGDPQGLQMFRNLNEMMPFWQWSDGYTSVADADEDGLTDVIVSGYRDATGGVYAYNRDNFLGFMPFPTGANKNFGGLVCVANVFDDRKMGHAEDWPELLAPSENRLTAFNLHALSGTPNQPFWWSLETADVNGLMAATAFDLNADGLDEVIVRDQNALRIVYGGSEPMPVGIDSARNWAKIDAPSGGSFDQNPIVADVDADGEAEILFLEKHPDNTTGAWAGRLVVVGRAGAEAWPSARKIWNQRAFSGLNIEPDGRVPVHQQSPSKAYSNGKRPFNRFLAQLPGEKAGIAAPDATARLDSVWCGADRFFLKIEVCNLGEAETADSLPLAFFDRNPTLDTAAKRLGPTFYLKKMEAGKCRLETLDLPLEHGRTVFGLLNFDEKKPLPTALGPLFPFARGRECRAENNLFSAFFDQKPPVLSLGPDRSGCSATAQILEATDGFEKYRWQDGSLERVFTAPGAGLFWCEATDGCGSRQLDSVEIRLDSLSFLDLKAEPSAICAGQSVVLKATGGPFFQFQWSPAPLVFCEKCFETDSKPLVQSVVFWATAMNGECITTDSVRVDLLSEPSVAADFLAPKCFGDSTEVDLTEVSGLAPFIFEWENGQKGPTIRLAEGDTMRVALTDAAGCRGDSTFFGLPAPPKMTVSLATSPAHAGLADGKCSVFPDGGVAPFSVAWSAAGNAGAFLHDSLAGGQHSVTITDALGCAATATFLIQEIVAAENFEDSGDGLFRLFPNPAAGVFFIEKRENAGRFSQPRLEVFDALGRLVFEKNWPEKIPRLEVDCAAWTTGNYLLKLKNNGQTIIFSLLIAR